MGLISDVLGFRNRLPAVFTGSSPLPLYSPARGSYDSFARAYSTNEIVYAAIELLATSAGEPHIIGRRTRRERTRADVRNAAKLMRAKGLRGINTRLVQNKFVEDLPNHPLVNMLNNPNPFMSRGQMWGTVVMDWHLAGNSYLLKVRAEPPFKPLPVELWRLRPDKVRVIPSKTKFIEGYEYDTGTERITIPANDIVHFKTRNPLDAYYGMPPLMPITGRLDIDGFMREFLRTFFERGGTGPGAILTVKQRMTQEQKDQIRDRAKRQFGAGTGFHEWLILDQTESSYEQLGLDRGLRDALPKELDAVSEARIAMIFGIPGSILGLLIGYESSSYANKRADWQVLWDIKMTPLLSDLDDVLNLSLVPEYPGIDEVLFDLDDIKALQEDVAALQDRERKNLQAGAISLEEYRDTIGYDPSVADGLFQVPGGVEWVPFSELGERETVVREVPPGLEGPGDVPALPEPENVIAEPRCPSCNRRVGANVQPGASLPCPRCRTFFEVMA